MLMNATVPRRLNLRIVPDFRTFFFPDRREVHYIGGADILPAPLEQEEEAAAVCDLGTDRQEQARKLLIEHNLRLVVYIAKKFDNTGVGVEDLISIGTIGLIKAINTFNPQKNIKLATYASRCIENEILMYLRRNNKTRLEVSIDEPLNVDWDGNELLLSDILGTEEDTIYKDLETEAERGLLLRAIGRLSGRERTIIKMRFGLGTPDGGRRGEDAKRGGRSSGDLSVLHIQTGEKDHAETEKRDGKIFIARPRKSCYNSIKSKRGVHMRLTCIGAAHEVTGSCHLLEACGKNILIGSVREPGTVGFSGRH